MLVLVLSLAPSALLQSSWAAGAPDLVLIAADDMAEGDWDVLPKTAQLLPAVYPNFFITDPLCCPSRATMLTGQYPHNHRTLGNGGSHGGWRSFVDHEDNTLAVALHHKGYRTALIGKYLNGYDADAGSPPGWDYWFGKAGGGYFGYSVAVGSRVERFGNKAKDYTVDVINRKSVQFIKESPRNTPLFAYIMPNAPHSPFTVAPRFEGTCDSAQAPRTPNFNVQPDNKPPYMKRDRPRSEDDLDNLERHRLCALKSVDDLVEAVVKVLEARGRPFDLIFVSDNGYLMGNFRRVGKGVPYEEAVRVSMRALGHDFPAGKHADLIGNIDLAPTFAAIAGATLKQPDGFDIRREQRTAMLLENFGDTVRETAEEEPKAQGRLDMESSPADRLHANWRAIRTSSAIYIETNVPNDGIFQEFYDLRDDPYELQNIAGSDPRVDSYKAALADLKQCSGSDCNSVNVSG